MFTHTLAREQVQDSVAGGCTIISIVVTREADVCEKPIKRIVIQRLTNSLGLAAEVQQR